MEDRAGRRTGVRRRSALTWEAVTLENTFQLTEPGQYFFNLGFFFEYSQSTVRGAPNGVTFGPIIQKELNDVLGLDTLHTLNVFLSRDVGHNSSKATGFEYAWQSLILTHPLISPGSSSTARSTTSRIPVPPRSSSTLSALCWSGR